MQNQENKIVKSQRFFDIHLYTALLLSSVRNEGETVVSEMNIKNAHPDIYIEHGLSKLNFPKHTYVEVKLNLLYDTFNRLYQQITFYKQILDISSLVIVYKNSSLNESLIKEHINYIKNNLNINFIECKSIDELSSLCAPIQTKIEEKEDSWESERSTLLEDAKRKIDKNNCSLFLGAGVSADAKMKGWEKLLQELLKNAQMQAHTSITEHDLGSVKNRCFNSSIITARYIETLYGNKDWKKDMAKILYTGLKPSKLVDAICNLIESKKIESAITYNYDDLIEEKLKQNGKIVPTSIFAKSRSSRGEFPVLHVHGIVPNPQNSPLFDPNPILTENEYHYLYKDTYSWSNIEQIHALDRNVCLLIGLSMSDPNLRRLLEFSQYGQEEQHNHYVFLERKPFGKEVELAKDRLHYQVMEQMMLHLGLRIIWFKDKAELPTLITKLV